MLLHGQFDDTFGNAWEVSITNPSAIAREYIIGQDNEFLDGTVSVYFTDDPINIETEIEDTFATIIKKSCAINLATNVYLGDLLFTGTDDIKVTVTKNNKCVFYGVVQPQTYSQPYTDLHDVFTLNCVDYLTTLGYHKYKNATAANYGAIKVSSTNVTFGDYIREQLSGFTTSVSGDVLYDNSKKITSADTDSILNQVAFNDQIVLGDTYDDVMTNEEVFEEILKYLNLHIIQEGYNFYIFDWGTLKNGREDWVSVLTGDAVHLEQYTLQMSEDIWRSTKTNLTVDKVYSQVKVKCDLEDQGTFITSPLESGDLYNLFGKRIQFCEEVISWGESQTAREAIWQYCRYEHGHFGPVYDGLKPRRYYAEVRENRYWNMYIFNNGQRKTIDNIYETDANGNYINQYKVPLYVKKNKLTPCIFGIGYTENTNQPEGGEPLGKYHWDDYLYISINGNLNDTESGCLPSSGDIQSHSSMIEYISPNAGGAYSPVDSGTNYIVFSGKLLLQPYANTSGTYEYIKNLDQPSYWNLQPVEMKGDGGEKAFVTRKYYNDQSTWLGEDSLNFISKDLKVSESYEYNYSSCGSSMDRYRKLPILECELTIGNKRLIETNLDVYGNSTFSWVTIGEEPYWVDSHGNNILEDGQPVKKTTFTLGVNPNIGDFIIGKEYNLQNTVLATFGIDAEGTAIPITKEDALAGAVVFKILGPVASRWKDITRRHPTFFRSEKFYEDDIYVLAHTENIVIKDFECKIYSSTNALDSNTAITESDDLIYISAENSKSIDDREEDFKLMTQLTAQEAKDKGLTLQSFSNAVVNVTANLPLSSIYNAITNENAKPEEHYVNAYYNEYYQPKLLLEADVKDEHAEFNSLFYNANLGKTFFVMKSDYEAYNGSRHLMLKEV